MVPCVPSGAVLPPKTTSEDMASAWRALADAAAALHRVASALSGSPALAASAPLSSPRPPVDDGPTLTDSINLFLVAKSRAGRSDAYLRQLRITFVDFSRGRGRTPLAELTAADVEEWVDGMTVGPRARKGRLQYVRTLFAFAQRRNLCAGNPALAVDLPATSQEAPGIHSPEEVGKLLEAARAWSPRLVRVLAVRYFAGLRAAEVARLAESDIGAEFITIPAHKAKTRQRRLVRIQPALRAWLDLGGVLPGVTCEQQLPELCQRAGVPWLRNAPRHSFVSYHLAAFGSAAGTALEAGHSEAMLFRHYRALVTAEAAGAFWAIRPSGGTG